MSRLTESIIAVAVLTMVGCAPLAPRIFPLCNMRCLPDGTCGADQAVTASEVDAMNKKILEQHPFARVDIVSITSAYSLQMISNANDAELRKSWIASACFTPIAPSDNGKYARLQQCLDNMPRWIQYSTPDKAKDLVIDPAFRQTCLGAKQ